MQDWIGKLTSLFRDNEPLLSGIGSFIAIVTAVSAIVGIFFRWRRRRYQIKSNKIDSDGSQPASSFPFEIIPSPDRLIELLFPDIRQQVIPDREIIYIPGRAKDLDDLFKRQGR